MWSVQGAWELLKAATSISPLKNQYNLYLVLSSHPFYQIFSHLQERHTCCLVSAMPRPVHLLIYHSPVFAAHWALWIPTFEKGIVGTTGKLISVNGNPSQGFAHEIERKCDLKDIVRSYSLKFLCMVENDNINDWTGEYIIDSTPTDNIERIACSVKAPQPSLRSASASNSKSRIEIKNCQTWLRELVVILVEQGIFSDESLIELDSAPKN
ncbi:hypothetical protein BGZ60DRAFT_396652 [Tricladium varicosporioides]|nr:hypothetical protein BGZ60DRAFT_396652 [Hymenoscyphus varicosporioides]